jgi:hypothetical protein
MHKMVYFEPRGDTWGPYMVDSMPAREGDENVHLPMPDYVDVLAMDNWEVVSAVQVDHPKPGSLLLIFKRPRD